MEGKIPFQTLLIIASPRFSCIIGAVERQSDGFCPFLFDFSNPFPDILDEVTKSLRNKSFDLP
jgi:hypothetical protein